MADKPSYKIYMNKQWSLEDLYVLPRTYEQVYFALYSLLDEFVDDEFEQARISHAYEAFPWQGGYSAVNFYNNLKYIVNKHDRPTIKSIQYASPGWIELTCVAVTITGNIGTIVKAISAMIKECNATYTDIVKGMMTRKLLRLKSKSQIDRLRASDLEYIKRSSKRMQKLMNIEGSDKIDARTGHPYKSLKILLSLYRRLRILVEYERSGKANFTGDDEVG